MASKEEVKNIVGVTGWDVGAFMDGQGGRYVAIIQDPPGRLPEATFCSCHLLQEGSAGWR